MFLSVLSFFLGVLLVQQLSMLPGTLFLVILLIFILLLAYLKYWRVTLILCGFLFSSVYAHYYLSNQLSADLQAEKILIQGEVIGLPEHNAHRVRFDFEVIQAAVPLPQKLRLSWYHPKQRVTAGQRWQFFVKLKRPHGTLNPGGFDYEKWLFARHIGATGYIRQAGKAKLLATKPLWLSLSVMRQTFIDLLQQQQLSSDSRALIKALTLGDKSSISTQQWQVLSKSGTSHLMAISGLHIGLVAGIIYFLVFQSWVRVPSNMYSAPQIAAVFSLIAAFFYAALAGFAIPTQRALIMLSMLMLTILLRRHVQTLNIFATAILLVLLIDPLAVLSMGFYLSFLSVFFIGYVLSARLGRQSRLFSTLKIHIVVGLSLLPVLLFFFQRVSIIAPIANMIAVPVVSFVLVPLSLLAVALLQLVPDISAVLLQIVDMVFQALWSVLVILSELPVANIVRPQPAVWKMGVAMLGILLLLAPRAVPGRYLGVLFILPLFLLDKAKPSIGEVTLTLLDVGQGLAVVVQTTEHSLVFDTGARFSDKFDMGSNVVVPFLHAQHMMTLDKLIISHADNDHIGGAQAVLSSIPVRQVLSSVPEQLSAHNAMACVAGDAWRWNQVDFHILSPPVQGFNNENNNSCVLKIDTKQGSILLTGDIEATAEYYLTNHVPEQLKSDVLIAPHHGSKTSSKMAFLQAVSPSIILIPADAPNRFSFPHADVLARYKQLGAQYFVTGQTGAITVKFNKGKAEVEAYRDRHSHYWNQPVM
ncbi:MAG: DNA internalization-related competence protein ComEC/Rec2 [Methyloprofundus sp.]|nr:DNA internalization-related competence protein ComEC/Rec2 [Methyloprofundus sp.]